MNMTNSPFCPQIPHEPPAFWDQLAPDDLPMMNAPDEVELGCLNLTITAPRTGLEQKGRSQIPVLVYIHGGAFIGGSQSISCAGRDLFDATSLVKSSLAWTKDIIVVTINYRLGVLGFLASKELEA